MMSSTKQKIIFLTIATAALVILRLAFNGHSLSNLFPIAALAIFSGSLLKNKKLAYMFPIAVLLLSDACLELFTSVDGFYGWTQIFNYAALILIAFWGTSLDPNKEVKVLGYTLGGTLLFWLVSNLGVWAGGYYGYTLAGLGETFLMAIPFYKYEVSTVATQFFVNSVAGNLLFAAICYFAYRIASIEYLKRLKPRTISNK